MFQKSRMNLLRYNTDLLILWLYLVNNCHETKSGRVKRFVSASGEVNDSILVSVPMNYGLDEEVENIERESSGEVQENDETTNEEQIQIIQKSNDKVTKVV